MSNEARPVDGVLGIAHAADSIDTTNNDETTVLPQHRALALWMFRTGLKRWKISQS